MSEGSMSVGATRFFMDAGKHAGFQSSDTPSDLRIKFSISLL